MKEFHQDRLPEVQRLEEEITAKEAESKQKEKAMCQSMFGGGSIVLIDEAVNVEEGERQDGPMEEKKEEQVKQPEVVLEQAQEKPAGTEETKASTSAFINIANLGTHGK